MEALAPSEDPPPICWIVPPKLDDPGSLDWTKSLRREKDREYVLKLEEAVLSFLSGQQPHGALVHFPSSTQNYQRMLAHKTAQYYGLKTATVSAGVVVSDKRGTHQVIAMRCDPEERQQEGLIPGEDNKEIVRRPLRELLEVLPPKERSNAAAAAPASGAGGSRRAADPPRNMAEVFASRAVSLPVNVGRPLSTSSSSGAAGAAEDLGSFRKRAPRVISMPTQRAEPPPPRADEAAERVAGTDVCPAASPAAPPPHAWRQPQWQHLQWQVMQQWQAQCHLMQQQHQEGWLHWQQQQQLGPQHQPPHLLYRGSGSGVADAEGGGGSGGQPDGQVWKGPPAAQRHHHLHPRSFLPAFPGGPPAVGTFEPEPAPFGGDAEPGGRQVGDPTSPGRMVVPVAPAALSGRGAWPPQSWAGSSGVRQHLDGRGSFPAAPEQHMHMYMHMQHEMQLPLVPHRASVPGVAAAGGGGVSMEYAAGRQPRLRHLVRHAAAAMGQASAWSGGPGGGVLLQRQSWDGYAGLGSVQHHEGSIPYRAGSASGSIQQCTNPVPHRTASGSGSVPQRHAAQEGAVMGYSLGHTVLLGQGGEGMHAYYGQQQLWYSQPHMQHMAYAHHQQYMQHHGYHQPHLPQQQLWHGEAVLGQPYHRRNTFQRFSERSYDEQQRLLQQQHLRYQGAAAEAGGRQRQLHQWSEVGGGQRRQQGAGADGELRQSSAALSLSQQRVGGGGGSAVDTAVAGAGGQPPPPQQPQDSGSPDSAALAAPAVRVSATSASGAFPVPSPLSPSAAATAAALLRPRSGLRPRSNSSCSGASRRMQDSMDSSLSSSSATAVETATGDTPSPSPTPSPPPYSGHTVTAVARLPEGREGCDPDAASTAGIPAPAPLAAVLSGAYSDAQAPGPQAQGAHGHPA